jgi:hypothetical protein
VRWEGRGWAGEGRGQEGGRAKSLEGEGFESRGGHVLRARDLKGWAWRWPRCRAVRIGGPRCEMVREEGPGFKLVRKELPRTKFSDGEEGTANFQGLRW